MIAVAVLLSFAVVVALVSAVGLLAAKDPYQRLHFLAPPATLSVVAVAVAFAVGEKLNQGWIKMALIAVVLATLNGVLSHATARAAWVRQKHHWPPDARDAEVTIVEKDANE